MEQVESTETAEAPSGEPQETTEKTYTQVEVDAALKTQFDTLNSKLSSQGIEIARLKAVPAPDFSAQKAVIAAIEKTQVEGEVNPELQVAKTHVATLEAQQQRAAQLAKQDAIADGQLADITRKIREAGFDPTAEEFEGVMDAYEYGRDVTGTFDKADTRLKRVLNKLKPEEKPRDLQVDIEEGIRAAMEKKGLLTVDGVNPAPGKGDWESIRDRYIKNPNNRQNMEDYEEMKRQKAKEK